MGFSKACSSYNRVVNRRGMIMQLSIVFSTCMLIMIRKAPPPSWLILSSILNLLFKGLFFFSFSFFFFLFFSHRRKYMDTFVRIWNDNVNKDSRKHLPVFRQACNWRYSQREEEKREKRNEKFFLFECVLTLDDRLTSAERISGVTFRASAHRVMIHYRTLSVRTAQTDTRIATLLLHTR